MRFICECFIGLITAQLTFESDVSDFILTIRVGNLVFSLLARGSTWFTMWNSVPKSFKEIYDSMMAWLVRLTEKLLMNTIRASVWYLYLFSNTMNTWVDFSFFQSFNYTLIIHFLLEKVNSHWFLTRIITRVLEEYTMLFDDEKINSVKCYFLSREC